MTQKQFLKRLKEVKLEAWNISRHKNSDYAGQNDAFLNFRLIENLTNGKVSAQLGILTRMTDKLQRIANLLEHDNQVKDESICDTLADLSNYSDILRLYIEDIHSSVRQNKK